MLVKIHVAVPQGGKPEVYIYKAPTAADAESITQLRDERNADAIIGKLAGDGAILAKPPAGATNWWLVEISTCGNRRNVGKYSAGYHKFPACPGAAIAAMMQIFADIKHALRVAKKEHEQMIAIATAAGGAVRPKREPESRARGGRADRGRA